MCAPDPVHETYDARESECTRGDTYALYTHGKESAKFLWTTRRFERALRPAFRWSHIALLRGREQEGRAQDDLQAVTPHFRRDPVCLAVYLGSRVHVRLSLTQGCDLFLRKSDSAIIVRPSGSIHLRLEASSSGAPDLTAL